MRELDITEFLKMLDVTDKPTTISLTPNMSGLEENPRNDWLYLGIEVMKKLSDSDVESMAIIGTGNGIDAIAASYIFPDLQGLYVTDLLEEALDISHGNIMRGFNPHSNTAVGPVLGRDCEPLTRKVNLIYGNLPLITADDSEVYESERGTTTLTSAAAYEHLSQGDADPLAMWSLLSQLGFLQSAKEKLNPGGNIITLIGGRVPDRAVQECFERAELEHRVLLTGFMRQSDPEFLEQYAAWEEEHGIEFKFHDYRQAEELILGLPGIFENEMIALAPPVLSGAEINARKAYELHLAGKDVGHLAHAYQAWLPT